MTASGPRAGSAGRRPAFDTVLIANRGEIALRVIRACRELGVGTVAVAAGDEREAPHAREADRLVVLAGRGGYLDAARLVAAAKEAGAQAVHPGYGFLSESPAFAEAVGAAGLAWIGPPPAAMRALGDKVAAKALARKTGLPVLPEGKEAGFPLLVKAAAGGGGRGQRVVREARDLEEALAAAGREAEAAFGDATVFLEKYLEAPRHVEFQILADARGRTVHLLERECSIQRRHQKLVEESPSPALTPGMREAMGAAAVRLAEAAGYRGAGTVEFLVEGDRFWFLEVNARLQVEHPVTEALLGLDLVQWQIRIALGEPFDGEVRPRGHAIEARLCAEDPDRDFLPSGGRVEALSLPSLPGLRWDTALEPGAGVGTDYDSLLAKAVAWAEDRPRALRRLDEALSRTVLLGFHQNLGYLRFVLNHPRFREGRYTTAFARETAEAWASRPRDLPPEALAVLARLREARPAAGGAARAGDPWTAVLGWLPGRGA